MKKVGIIIIGVALTAVLVLMQLAICTVIQDNISLQERVEALEAGNEALAEEIIESKKDIIKLCDVDDTMVSTIEHLSEVDKAFYEVLEGMFK